MAELPPSSLGWLQIHPRWSAGAVHEGVASAWAMGTATREGRLLREPELAAELAAQPDTAAAKAFIRSLSGFFSVAWTAGPEAVFASDRVRAHPLFYTLDQGRLRLSDDARHLQTLLNRSDRKDAAWQEFCLQGFVSGRDTLVEGVNQVQGTEIIHVNDKGETKSNFTAVGMRRDVEETFEAALARLDQVTVDCLQRTLDYAAGRPLVVPLSGGLDSRLIVGRLRLLQPELPIITFTYGRSENDWEVKRSRAVAEKLGLPWHLVIPTAEDWAEFGASDEFQEYWRFAERGVSLPHIQDFLAVRHLTRNGIIPADAVIVPGHSADLPAGSRSLQFPELYQNSPYSAKRTLDALSYYHHLFFHPGLSASEAQDFSVKRLKMVLDQHAPFNHDATAFELWDDVERQGKYIINSLRCYEFFGLDWWLPFWDGPFIDFWQGVPVDRRLGKRLYVGYVDQILEPLMGAVSSATPNRLKAFAKSIAMKPALRRAVRRLRRRLGSKKETYWAGDPIGWFALFPKEQVRRVFENSEVDKSIMTLLIAARYGLVEGGPKLPDPYKD